MSLLTINEVREMIPQKHPFVMTGELLEADTTGFTSTFLIEEDNVLVENGLFDESGLMENIAQTAASGFGYLDRESEEPGKAGFIGAITKVKLYDCPMTGDLIRTRVDIVMQFENVFLIRGKNFLGEQPLLECEMKIVTGMEIE